MHAMAAVRTALSTIAATAALVVAAAMVLVLAAMSITGYQVGSC